MTNFKVTKIALFSPTGKNTIPSGSYFQKGGFLNECRKNKAAFETGILQFEMNQNGVVSDLKKSNNDFFSKETIVVVFPIENESLSLSEELILNWLNGNPQTLQKMIALENRWYNLILKFIALKFQSKKEELRYNAAFSIGNFFKGNYCLNRQQFNNLSICLQFQGISIDKVLWLTKRIANDLKIESYVLKRLYKKSTNPLLLVTLQ